MSQQLPAPKGDWASQITDRIEMVVGQVRDRTTQPVVKLTRGVVFGLLAAILGISALVLVIITWFRVLSFLPGGMWVAYLITGILLLIAGAIAMSKRHSSTEPV